MLLIHAADEAAAQAVVDDLQAAFIIGAQPVAPLPIVLDGWLLYDLSRHESQWRCTSPASRRSGSRRWFLWIPAAGDPRWLIHAIEGSTFRSVRAEVAGEMDRYAGWRELESKLAALVQTPHGPARRIAMEYSPQNAIPYVSLGGRRARRS
jgi:Xaa-Pro dipeptidase